MTKTFDTTELQKLVTSSPAKRIKALQFKMLEAGIDAWIARDADPHNSEYLSEGWKTREWLSGFNGSAGTLVVLSNWAGLWTDGRYHIQAASQLEETGITLMKQGLPGVPSIEAVLSDKLDNNSTVGFDGKVICAADYEKILNALERKNVSFKTDKDLVNDLWTDKPELQIKPIYEHPVNFAGKSRIEKITDLREVMKTRKIDRTVISALDDIAWLFNIRGEEIDHTPLTLCFAVVSHDEVSLCINPEKVTESLKEILVTDGVKLCSYDAIYELVTQFGSDETITIDKSTVSTELSLSINPDCHIIDEINITTHLKAVKTACEIENFKRCLIRDGVSVVKFSKWFEDQIENGASITEMDVVNKLAYFRSQDPTFKGSSFDTIAGYAANGAMMHYLPDEDNAADLHSKSFLLLDSGGQYFDGTTDITRTFALGDVNDQEKRDYTLVLKGHINMARTVFLEGTRGTQIDIMARSDMWKECIDYACATGHGVGYFLSVHEGPFNVGRRFIDEELKADMIVTNEPGIYRNGVHGVRIENIMLCKEYGKSEFGNFFSFETITMCPIELKAVDFSMLTTEEIDWLNDYHQQVFDTISPHLEGDLLEYLREKTKAV